jgi:hypothetical protein
MAPWILAIDFGTSYTVAATAEPGRRPEVIEIDGSRRVPSVVLVDGDQFLVGKIAEELASAYPGRALRAPKKRLGDNAPVVLDGRPHQIADIVAALLRDVYEDAVRHAGSPPAEVRLTHPAVWARPLQNRLLEAAVKAGLPNPVLVPEPVAAALAYATEAGVPDGAHVAIYDLGGGTFDTAVVTPAANGFRIVGRPGGDSAIGGELFDELLTEHVALQLDPAVWETMQTSDDPTWRKLFANMRAEVRRGKESLSSYPIAELLVPVAAGLVQVRVTREEFEEIVAPFVETTIDLTERCVRDAGVDPQRLAAVYLVGGASRSPIVARRIEARFPGVVVSRRGDPKTSTALGAALAVRSPDLPDPTPRPAGVPTPPPTPFASPPLSRPPSVPEVGDDPTVVGPGVTSRRAAVSFGPASELVTQPQPATTAVQPVQPAPTASQGPPRKRRRGVLLAGIGALVLVAGVATGLAVALGGDDASSSGSDGDDTVATTEPAITASSTSVVDAVRRCVNSTDQPIRIRQAPGESSPRLGAVPPGGCVDTFEAAEDSTGDQWRRVTYRPAGGAAIDGWIKESLLLAPGATLPPPAPAPTAAPTTAAPTTAAPTTAAPTTAPTSTAAPATGAPATSAALAPTPSPVQQFVADYYRLTTVERDYAAAWNMLTAHHQSLFAGGFDQFTGIFERIKTIEVLRHEGCTTANPPTTCYFRTRITNTNGRVSDHRLRFDMVRDGGQLRVNNSADRPI